MSVSKEDKKVEAIARMKSLGIFSETINQFDKVDYVSISEPPFGAFYWAEDEDLKRIREFEEQYNAVVYVVIRSYTDIGKMDSYLYVSDHEEEWERDRDDLENLSPIAYVYNHDAPYCSEFGSVGLKRSVAAGLLRIW